MSWLPYVILLAVLFGLLLWSQRRRRQQMADEMVRISQIGFGAEVMTTSGLYGTVVGMNDDGTVQLAIAPGVEVKWALAALRDATSLPERYRRGMGESGPDETPDEPGSHRPEEPGLG